MATLFLFRRPLLAPLSLGLGLSTAFFAHNFYVSARRPLLCDTGSIRSSAFQQYKQDAKVPIVKQGWVKPGLFKQISSGSILGLVGGLAVSTFSKSLASLIGLMVFMVQAAASRGYNIVPTTRLQQYVKSIDLRSAIEDNVAFKLSFGATFMLAAFAEF